MTPSGKVGRHCVGQYMELLALGVDVHAKSAGLYANDETSPCPHPLCQSFSRHLALCQRLRFYRGTKPPRTVAESEER